MPCPPPTARALRGGGPEHPLDARFVALAPINGSIIAAALVSVAAAALGLAVGGRLRVPNMPPGLGMQAPVKLPASG
ncbi:hypothetical protein, partial [Streptomyces shenzhenensis]